MASVRALSGAGGIPTPWSGATTSLRSYLLCCFTSTRRGSGQRRQSGTQYRSTDDISLPAGDDDCKSSRNRIPPYSVVVGGRTTDTIATVEEDLTPRKLEAPNEKSSNLKDSFKRSSESDLKNQARESQQRLSVEEEPHINQALPVLHSRTSDECYAASMKPEVDLPPNSPLNGMTASDKTAASFGVNKSSRDDDDNNLTFGRKRSVAEVADRGKVSSSADRRSPDGSDARSTTLPTGTSGGKVTIDYTSADLQIRQDTEAAGQGRRIPFSPDAASAPFGNELQDADERRRERHVIEDDKCCRQPLDDSRRLSGADSQVTSSDGVTSQPSTETVCSSIRTAQENDDDRLFDVSDLRDRELISSCGRLRVTLCYSIDRARLSVTVHSAQDLPGQDRIGATNTQVHLVIIPTKVTRHKTKVKAGECPSYEETFQFKVPQADLPRSSLRFRLYGVLRSRRRQMMLGESVVSLTTILASSLTSQLLAKHNADQQEGAETKGIPLTSTVTQWITLEPRSNLSTGYDTQSDRSSTSRSRSGSATSSTGDRSSIHGGGVEGNVDNDDVARLVFGSEAGGDSAAELLLGLMYNGTTGRLSVEVVKGSNLQAPSVTRPPDTYVKLTLMSTTGREIARSKTSVRRHQPHPVFRETFMFQVVQSQLALVSLHVSVFSKRSMKREAMIGWFTLGSSNSSDEEKAHWDEMCVASDRQTERWHQLLEP